MHRGAYCRIMTLQWAKLELMKRKAIARLEMHTHTYARTAAHFFHARRRLFVKTCERFLKNIVRDAGLLGGMMGDTQRRQGVRGCPPKGVGEAAG